MSDGHAIPTRMLMFWLMASPLVLLSTTAKSQTEDGIYFYKPVNTGSDAVYNPLHQFLSYTLDPVQIPDDFGIDNFENELHDVWYQLTHPRQAIEEEGGLKRFINREIFPVDSAHSRDSLAALPNYALHLLGGGLVFRKDLEWFRSHDYPFPGLLATVWSMTAEVLQEAIERKTTIDTDPIADVYLFRPIGLALFSQDWFARFIHHTLDPAVWPMLHAWDVGDDRFLNTGIAYVYRPPVLSFGNKRGFIYTGLNTLFGLSQQTASGGTVSWGVGAAVQNIESQRDIKVTLKPSLGMFYDRNNSLQWSAILNDTGDNRFRLNMYPLDQGWIKQAGWFLSINDEGDISAGVSLSLPLGIGVSSN